jgi:hypothetical protein
MSEGPALLIPNLAAEEGAVWHAAGGERAVRCVVRLWSALFPPDAQLMGSAPSANPPAARDHVGPFSGAAFDTLEPVAAYAWLNTAEAERVARAHGLALAGAPPAAVQRVHDKAFALEVACREGLVPAAFERVRCFEAEALRRDPEAALDELEAELRDWPPGRFTLKPRWGSSGRGRVGGQVGRLDRHSLGGALDRLAARGGAILEPWVERRGDLAAQLWIDADRSLRLLGTATLLVSPAGVYRGHRGTVDNKGRVTSGDDVDEVLREAAAIVANAAGEAGYRGPCGVDAFHFIDSQGRGAFRPIVEFNARFTVGTVVLGWLRRLLPQIRKELPADAGERRGFLFLLDRAAGPHCDFPAGRARDGLLWFDLAAPDGDDAPALFVTRHPEQLLAWEAASGTPRRPTNGEAPPEM